MRDKTAAQLQSDREVAERLFAGPGEMRQLMRELDWSRTAVGPVGEWPPELRTAVDICLSSKHPIELWWGPDYVRFYNDAYRPILGREKHPQFLGQRGADCWAEIWDVIGPMLDDVRERDEATWVANLRLTLTRNGFPEETYFTFSYSPVHAGDGSVAGVFSAVTETTSQVVDSRRLHLFRDLAERAAVARTAEAACELAASCFGRYSADLPFALIYLLDEESGKARLAAASGLEPGGAASPRAIDAAGDAAGDATWPLASVQRSGEPHLVEHLTRRFGAMPGGPWPESAEQALVFPLTVGGARGRTQLAGFLIAGVSPRLALDERYRDFLDLVAGHVAGAIANARAHETEHRRSEALGRETAAWRAAELAEERLQRMYQQAPLAMALLRGPEHVFEIANARYLEIAGKESVVGQSIREAFPELAGQGVYERLDQVFTSGKSFRAREQPVTLQRGGRLDEVVLDWVYEPLVDATGRVEGITVIVTEVTALVHAREAAQRYARERDAERRQLLTVLEQSPLGIIIAEAETGRYLFTNSKVAEIWGERDHLNGLEEVRSALRVFHLDGRPLEPHEWPLGRALERGETVDREILQVERAGGRRVDVAVMAAPVRDAEGRIIAAVGIFADVTAERRTERQLRDAQRMQAVGTLAGGVAHEVNNQMTAVLGFGQLILNQLGRHHPLADDLRQIIRAGERAGRVTQQLLAFSRQQITQPRVLDLHLLTTGIAPVLQQVLGADKELVIAPDRASRRVNVDPRQVEQVLINLVANARDATETGARVTITVEDTNVSADDIGRGGPAHVTIMAPGRYVRLTVSDTGRGMDAQTLARIFEPFFTTKPVGQGTGLGLSMVYGIVKQHGGYIWAYSEPDVGTTMKLYWPATDEAQVATVLVIEDEPSVRELTVRTLEQQGYRVIAASDGAEAVAMVRQGRVEPDVVVTDVVMPHLNGRQVREEIQALRPGVPVLFMSGYTGDDVVLRRLVPEDAPFLQKPFTPDRLARWVRELLSGRTI